MKRTLIAVLATLSLPALAQNDGSLSAAARSALRGSSLHAVQVSAERGVVTLTGSVPVFSDKLQARADIAHIPGVTAIQDRIVVTGPAVPDATLQRRLESQIAFNTYGRTRELPTRTQAISVRVHNGSVTLTGRNADPLFASIAFQTAANTPGVQSIADHLQTKAVSTAANGTAAFSGTGGLSTVP